MWVSVCMEGECGLVCVWREEVCCMGMEGGGVLVCVWRDVC